VPIADDSEIVHLLTTGRIKALTVDTNIFYEKGWHFKSPALQAIEGLKARPLRFVLSSTIKREVRSRFVEHTEDALRRAKREIGKALAAFETSTPPLDTIVAQIFGTQAPGDAARQRLDEFLTNAKCDVATDSDFVDVDTLFDSYFNGNPPFGADKKKHQFPDALALKALEGRAKQDGMGILVVSKDNDWKSFCEKSDDLYWVSDIERALSLVTKGLTTTTATGLRHAVVSWLSEDGEGRQEVHEHTASDVKASVFNANGYPTFGEMEATPREGYLTNIIWPDAQDMDIIQFSAVGPNEHEVVVSVPVTLCIDVPVDLSFSVWDDIDDEPIYFGGRTERVDCDLDVRVSMTLCVSGLGTNDPNVAFRKSEIDTRSFDVELGEVDTLEPEDWGPEDAPE